MENKEMIFTVVDGKPMRKTLLFCELDSLSLRQKRHIYKRNSVVKIYL